MVSEAHHPPGLWIPSSVGKRGDSYVNQAVVKNDVHQNFLFVGILTYYCTCKMRICTEFLPRWDLCIFKRISHLLMTLRNIHLSSEKCQAEKYVTPDVFLNINLNCRFGFLNDIYYWWWYGDINYAYSSPFTENIQYPEQYKASWTWSLCLTNLSSFIVTLSTKCFRGIH